MHLTTPLKEVLHTTREYLAILEGMNIRTVEDLLLYLPRTHEDLSHIQTIATSKLGEKVSIRGTIRDVKLVFMRSRKKLVTARFIDCEEGTAELIWFNQPHVKRILQDGAEIVITGKLIEDGRKIVLQSPQFEAISNRPLVHTGRLVPIYPQHDMITSRWLREKMVIVRDAIDILPETLPEDILREENLMGRSDAIKSLHFPEKPEDVERARDRMAFEEMFRMQKDAIERKMAWQQEHQERLQIPMHPECIRQFFASLKFTPTGSQKIAIYEILKDMEKDVPMSRLLEGDVGSGKTLVATAVIAHTIAAKGQCALMAPTEVLARQHAQTITRLLINFSNYMRTSNKQQATSNPTIALLTGSTPSAEKESIKTGLANGTVDLVIGTHALIEEDVIFKNLLFTIIDEQHRFGVLQREKLKEKGGPHVLAMTATPIPRTLALTAYGDHDLSVLTEKPGNRRKIHTKVAGPKDRRTIEAFIDRSIGEGRQVFVICPLIEPKEENCRSPFETIPQGDMTIPLSDLKSVEAEVSRLRTAFQHRRITFLHGQMAPKEKEETMRQFKEKQCDILVSTSVIEVGIDVPNATIIVIEGAERFGLSQLHQFRGRVGRSDHQSYCFLFTTTPAHADSPRIKAMEEHDSGFVLAEIDLKIRGPGELFGTRQSGLPDSILQSLFNPELVVRARRAAEKFFVPPSPTAVGEGMGEGIVPHTVR
ncbi:hypothetical protein A3H90_02070 [Candidatus Peribacteria bacterium RIFCSPLOWO2_02_FULL_55_36]|nr:MAG: hypothetical protein A3H90_02070 [Candidatus Peribacteria bacterium RIFCSPLOWO2_02_FULL_55_36]